MSPNLNPSRMPCLTQVLTRQPVGDDASGSADRTDAVFERGLQLVEGGARLRAIGAGAGRGERLNGGLQTQSPAPTGAGTIPAPSGSRESSPAMPAAATPSAAGRLLRTGPSPPSRT